MYSKLVSGAGSARTPDCKPGSAISRKSVRAMFRNYSGADIGIVMEELAKLRDKKARFLEAA